ncbi:hypothetical protein RDWZM_003466 [Blomia tropicalis]|uniref:Uncharacterized protein n=1 Tax=Blomia tropicalis TaxID=40697 RepID=A0A9Q0RT24_BLOTA|nr:hypothetical protein RDWZM_003466 [Blomia tropicalis]
MVSNGNMTSTVATLLTNITKAYSEESTMSSNIAMSTTTTTSSTTTLANEVLDECWSTTEFAMFRIPEFRSLPTSILILLAIALLVTLWALVKFIQALWTYFICYLLGFGAKWRPGPNSWAIVTGSTDGIGLAYAKAMARKGYCLMLISRTQQKLEKVKTEILNEFPNCPAVKILPVDFTLDSIYKHIAQEISTLDVTRMTHIVLPLMEKNRSGIIINISSYSALFPTPLLALYSASKIYMDYFSRALHSEYCDRGIVVQSVLPYYVSTNMIRNPGISLMIPSPDQFVRSALKTVGVEVRTYGYFAHNILAFFQSFFVKFVIGNNLNTKIAFFRMKRFRKGCYKRKGLNHKEFKQNIV